MEVGELRLAVGPPGPVPTVQVGIVGVHRPTHVVGGARHRDDPSRVRTQQRRHQQRGEGEVPEVVDAELHLEAVDGLALGDAHHAGVVDEDVDRLVAGEDPPGGLAHRCQRAEIELDDLQGCARRAAADVRLGLRRLLLVAGRYHYLGARRRQRTRGLEPEAAVGAGDDRRAARQVWNVSDAPAHRDPLSKERVFIHAQY